MSNQKMEQMTIMDAVQKVYSEYGNDGVPGLANKISEILIIAFQQCAALCEKGGDETISYNYFTVNKNSIRREMSNHE